MNADERGEDGQMHASLGQKLDAKHDPTQLTAVLS